MKPKRLTKEEFVERVKDLYGKFYSHLEGVSFQEFYEEALKEFQKQQKMSDEELESYRVRQFKDLIKETDKLISLEEKKRYEEEDMKILNEQDLMENARNKKM